MSGRASGGSTPAWGDAFFCYAPDGVTPRMTQPYGTIVTKNYPDTRACGAAVLVSRGASQEGHSLTTGVLSTRTGAA